MIDTNPQDQRYWVLCFGVSGTGKSSIAKALASHLKTTFVEADEFHSAENIEKMSKGIGLSDEERKPWLSALSSHIAQLEQTTSDRFVCVVACSALTPSYRSQLTSLPRSLVVPVFLHASYALLEQRVLARSAHFAKVNLLHSQFQTLIPPSLAEFSLPLIQPDLSLPLSHLVQFILSHPPFASNE